MIYIYLDILIFYIFSFDISVLFIVDTTLNDFVVVVVVVCYCNPSPLFSWLSSLLLVLLFLSYFTVNIADK